MPPLRSEPVGKAAARSGALQRQPVSLAPAPSTAELKHVQICTHRAWGWKLEPQAHAGRSSGSSGSTAGRPQVLARARLSLKEEDDGTRVLREMQGVQPRSPADVRRMATLVQQLQGLRSYTELQAWLSMQARGSSPSSSKGSDGSSRHVGVTEHASLGSEQVDVHLCVAVLAKAAQELEELFWGELEDLSFEEVLSRHEDRHEALELLFWLLMPKLSELPLLVLAYCVYTASTLHDAYSEAFFKALCQQIVRGSNSHAANSSADGREVSSSSSSSSSSLSHGQASPSAPVPRLMLPPDSTDEEITTTLEQLSLGLATACHYAPGPMQLLAREITLSVASCTPSSLARMLGAFMQLQHYDKAMLNAVGVHLLRPSTSTSGTQQAPSSAGTLNVALLDPMEALQVAQAFVFFNVQNPAFYQVLLARVSAASPSDLDVDTATIIYMTYQLLPSPAPPMPPALAEQLALAADRLMEDIEADRLIKTEYITGGGLESHDELEESEIVKVQEMLRYQAFESLCMRQIWRLLSTAQRASGVVPPPSLQMECFSRASPQSPWATVPMAIPCQALDGTWQHVALVVLTPGSYCENVPTRLLGSVQTRLRCLQAMGWPVWPLNVGLWHEQVMDAAAMAGLADDYEAASLAWAQSVSGGPHAMDAATRAKVDNMVSDLSSWVQQMVEGAATLNTPTNSKAAQWQPVAPAS